MPETTTRAVDSTEGVNPTLKAVELTKRFRGVTALDAVSIDLCAGEVHALVGENGAGKSTLIKVINGLYPADEGVISLDDEPVAFNGPHEAWGFGISTVFQEINLEPFLSVAQNLFLGREPTRRWGFVDVKAINREAAVLLRRYGIDVDERRPLGSVGVAVQQMIAIVRAVSTEAKVVILDEPTRGIDVGAKAEIQKLIDELAESGLAVILISSELEDVIEGSNRVFVLKDGTVVGELHGAEISEDAVMDLIAHGESRMERP
jgi:ribose transport system ATP-binding protein